MQAVCDHRIPLSRGGTNRVGNLVVACFICDRYKESMTEEEFLYSPEFKRIKALGREVVFEEWISHQNRDRASVSWEEIEGFFRERGVATLAELARSLRLSRRAAASVVHVFHSRGLLRRFRDEVAGRAVLALTNPEPATNPYPEPTP